MITAKSSFSLSVLLIIWIILITPNFAPNLELAIVLICFFISLSKTTQTTLSQMMHFLLPASFVYHLSGTQPPVPDIIRYLNGSIIFLGIYSWLSLQKKLRNQSKLQYLLLILYLCVLTLPRNNLNLILLACLQAPVFAQFANSIQKYVNSKDAYLAIFTTTFIILIMFQLTQIINTAI